MPWIITPCVCDCMLSSSNINCSLSSAPLRKRFSPFRLGVLCPAHTEGAGISEPSHLIHHSGKFSECQLLGCGLLTQAAIVPIGAVPDFKITSLLSCIMLELSCIKMELLPMRLCASVSPFWVCFINS